MMTAMMPSDPLRPCPANPRYFSHADGLPVYLTGSHHWDNLVDNDERPGEFDFEAYLDRLESWGHNFIRLWAQWAWVRPLHPCPYLRPGPGTARDNLPRFDLSRFNPEYFDRLRQRVERAGQRGLYVSVMLFQGWSLRNYGEGNPWPFHPYHRDNNVNGVSGDPENLGEGGAVHSLANPEVTRLQERYAERVVEAVGDFPHVLYEISNESPRESLPWQMHMLEHLRQVETRRQLQHPIGMTAPYGGGANLELLAGPADWISPDHRGGFRRAPPPATGNKVILLDTDHLWGIGGDRKWVWKSLTRGYNPLYMDPLQDHPAHGEVRRALGEARAFAARLDLASLVPLGGRSSSGYCLASLAEGQEEMLVYLPFGRGASITLSRKGTEFEVEWLHPETGERSDGTAVRCRTRHRFRSPYTGDSLLYLRSPGLARS